MRPSTTRRPAAQAADGEIYVADGLMAISSVHRFAADGTLLATWGGPGAGPGAFTTPHAIWVDRFGKVLVGGSRRTTASQVFDREGAFPRRMGRTSIIRCRSGWTTATWCFVTDQIPRIQPLERRRQAGRPLPRAPSTAPMGFPATPKAISILAELAAAGDHQARTIELTSRRRRHGRGHCFGTC